MAQRVERMFYTTDRALQEALLDSEAAMIGNNGDQDSSESSDSCLEESDLESNASEDERDVDYDAQSALENIADRYYQRNKRIVPEGATRGEKEAEQWLTREHFQKGCGCSLDCFSDFTASEVADAMLSLKQLSKSDRDMFLLGKLQTFYEPPGEGSVHPICFIHGVGDFSLRSLKKHLRDNGVTPRVHGNKGKKPAHAHTRVDNLSVLSFIHQYAKVNGLPQPAPPKGRAGQPLLYLPASQSKKSVYCEYECACASSNKTPVGYRSFRNIWRRCLPWIRFMAPRTDVCYRCELHRLEVKNALNENDKAQCLKRFSDHLETAKLERDFYRKATKAASKELEEYKGNISSRRAGACSRNLRASHYTFNFAQSVSIPYHARQPGPVYFKTARKVHLFGVCNEGIPKQVNYLIDESQTIGHNGKMAHGPNSVISMLHHYFAKHGLGEKSCVVHADNCAGQNKNRSVIAYLAWRCMTGLHEDIQLCFMVVGHTRCLVDGCFGLIKQKCRKSDCDTLVQLQIVVEDAASVNCAQLYQVPGSSQPAFQWYEWVSFLNKRFKALSGIRSFQHFRFSRSSPGSVFVKESATAEEQKINLLHSTHPPIRKTLLPATIKPAGLTLDRKQYLFTSIREHVWDPYKDVTCPDPAT